MKQIINDLHVTWLLKKLLFPISEHYDYVKEDLSFRLKEQRENIHSLIRNLIQGLFNRLGCAS